MMKTATVSMVLVGLATATAAPLKELQYQVEFAAFTKAFDKQYQTHEIMGKYNTFKKNHQMIQEENAKNLDYKLGINQFADLNQEEFKAYMTGYTPPTEMRATIDESYKYKASNGTSIDWVAKGAVVPIKNQGQCGSCWAFSTVASTEGANFLTNGHLISLSEQQLVDCAGSEGNQGCNGGLMDNGFKWITKNGGLCTEASYPYKGADGTCQQCTKVQGTDIISYKDITVGDENELLTSLVNVGPHSIAIEADQSGFQFYKSGVFSGTCGTQLDHGVTLVGAGTDNGVDYWTVKNSWGTTWGDAGYIKMKRGMNECGVANAASVPTVAQVKPTPPPAPTPAPPPTPKPTTPPRHQGECDSQTTQSTCGSTEQNGVNCNWCNYANIFQYCTVDACTN